MLRLTLLTINFAIYLKGGSILSDVLTRDFLNMMNNLFNIRRINYSKEMLNSEYHIMAAIYYNSHKSMTISELAEKIHVSPPAISRSIKGLEEKGWINRFVDSNDRRTTFVVLTDLGESKYLMVKKQLKDFLNEVLENYDESELNHFISFGNNIYNDFSQKAEIYNQRT